MVIGTGVVTGGGHGYRTVLPAVEKLYNLPILRCDYYLLPPAKIEVSGQWVSSTQEIRDPSDYHCHVELQHILLVVSTCFPQHVVGAGTYSTRCMAMGSDITDVGGYKLSGTCFLHQANGAAACTHF